MKLLESEMKSCTSPEVEYDEIVIDNDIKMWLPFFGDITLVKKPKSYMAGRSVWNPMEVVLERSNKIDQRIYRQMKKQTDSLSEVAANRYKFDFEIGDWQIQGAFLMDVQHDDLDESGQHPRYVTLNIRYDNAVMNPPKKKGAKKAPS